MMNNMHIESLTDNSYPQQPRFSLARPSIQKARGPIRQLETPGLLSRWRLHDGAAELNRRRSDHFQITTSKKT
jgi:hypothetical protein